VSRLLVVDDEAPLRHWAERVLGDHGYACEGAGDAMAARARLDEQSYELALLDVNMPGESGMDLLAHIRASDPDCAVVMVTGEDSVQLALSAIEHGAYGYIIKPAEAGELLINVANALHRRRHELATRRLLQRLHDAATERGEQLEQALQELEISQNEVWASRAETIFRLARMVEYRDEETGQHVQRMSDYCQILARALGLPPERCELIRLASQLHDIGKVAISDTILLKPGKLTDSEFETIKTHTEIGYDMLRGSHSEVVQVGALIARTHHERWDGAGYPQGLAHDAIPLEGRIAAVADVFDALTSDRVYRPAFPFRDAVRMLAAERESHFDPTLADAFVSALPDVERVREAYAV